MREVEREEAQLDALLDAVGTELAADGLPQAGDDAIIARAVEAALARANAGRANGLRLRKRGAGRGVLLAAALLIATSAAFALIERAKNVPRTPEQIQSTEAMQNPSPTRPPAALPRAVAEGADTSSSGAPETRSARPSSASSLEPTAQDLFAQANETRRHGEATAAVRQYATLQRRFPHSPEASLSLVALGRLYLDRLESPARALSQFDQYLAGAPDGELREEALVGKAIAFQRLGRTTDEKAAWQALLAAFPNSVSASRAVARLAELH